LLPLPKVSCDQKEKVHVSEPDFLAMLRACDTARLPDPKIHRGVDPADWWRAILLTAWVTGARIESILKLRWVDVDFDTGRVLSRAADLKQRKDTRPEIAGALPHLLKIRAHDSRLLPWNHHKRTLYKQFYAIQQAAGIDLPCPHEGEPGHVCGDSCHLYGFHAFRYAHARFNYEIPELQNQMGHACASTTDHYRRWAKRQAPEYGAYLPDGLDGNQGAKQRKNGGTDSGKPSLRVVGA
jgi:integrase